MREALVGAIGQRMLEETSAAVVAALWERAERAGMWGEDDADARALLRRIAARRLMEALIADGIDVAEWPRRCRDFELQALRAFASEVSASPALAAWPREQRTAVGILAQAWGRVGEAGAYATLIRLAPPEVASRWIREHVTRAMPNPEVHDIVLAAEGRKDRAILAALVERLEAGAIDASVHRDDLQRALADVDPEAYERFVLRHMPDTPDSEIVSFHGLPRAKLLRHYDEYASERTSFGFQQKAAVIDALVVVGVSDAADRALVLAKIAHREAESLNANAWIVQAAYLRALAANVSAWPRHAAYVGELFAGRVNAELSLIPGGMEPAAVDLLGKLTADQVLQLLALPPGIVNDEIDGRWEPRWYILRALGESDSRAGETVANEVFGRLPMNDELRLRVVRAMARSGPNMARTFLTREYLRDPKRNHDYLDVLGDLGAEAFFRQQIAAGDATVLEAAARLPNDAARCRLFNSAVGRFVPSPHLLTEAGRCRIVHDAFVTAAVRELRNGPHPADVAAMKYLAAIEREQQVVDDAARVLRASAPFEWFALAQELPPRSAKEGSIEALLGERALLLVTDSAEPGMFSAAGRGVWNPLLERYASRGDARAARTLLEWSRRSRQVEALGSASDPAVLYRAYCLWLAAPAARHLPLSELGVTHLLAENNPALVRAAASVCLGVTGT